MRSTLVEQLLSVITKAFKSPVIVEFGIALNWFPRRFQHTLDKPIQERQSKHNRGCTVYPLLIDSLILASK